MTARTAASTQTRATLVEDRRNPVLNSVSHASEHCALDDRTLEALGSSSGRQVLLRQSAEQLALYTIAELSAARAAEVRVGSAGAARLRSADATPSRAAPSVTLQASVVSDDDEAPARLTEELLGDDAATGVAILAPHGGKIEAGTDDQAQVVYDVLAQHGAPARAWIARGHNPLGAQRCWHITSSEISEHSFPKLATLFGDGTSRGPFGHAVAFHGHNDSEAIVIGGGLPNDRAHTALKLGLQSRIRRALEAVSYKPPPIEIRSSGPLAGTQRQNIVNRVTAAGNGIQLEQPLSVRQDCAQRVAIARAVGIFYAELH